MKSQTVLVVAVLGAACAHQAPSTGARGATDSVQIGYGAQPEGKTSGAVTALSADDLSKARPLRIEDLLRGKVAGLDIVQSGNSVSFRIRGMPSMTQDAEPLVIVDDEPILQGNIVNALAGLTPDDIKQVSVLKDVASTAIYGTRGAAGVILITTTRKHDDKTR
jgi:TonB-dependent SusC/RagA subfamily outer membrane receptor